MIAEKREKFIVRAGKGIVWCAAGELICIIFNLCMLAFIIKFMAFKIFTAVASAIITNGLYINFAYNCAVRDRNLIKYHKVPHDPLMSVKLAFAAPLPQYLLWAALLLSKTGVIGDIFNYYIWSNIQCLAWVDLFTAGRDIGSLSAGGLIALFMLTFLSSVCIGATYECTIRDFDVKAWLLYGKK